MGLPLVRVRTRRESPDHRGDPGTTSGFDIGTAVGGNVKISENAGLTFIDAAEVGGNLEVSENTGTLEIEHNTLVAMRRSMTTSCRRRTRADRPHLFRGVAAFPPPSFSRSVVCRHSTTTSGPTTWRCSRTSARRPSRSSKTPRTTFRASTTARRSSVARTRPAVRGSVLLG